MGVLMAQERWCIAYIAVLAPGCSVSDVRLLSKVSPRFVFFSAALLPRDNYENPPPPPPPHRTDALRVEVGGK